MNSNLSLSLDAFKYSNIEKAFQSDIQKTKADVPKEHLKEMIKEHERLVDVLDSPSHEDDKKESKKQKKELKEYKQELKKAFETLGVKSDFEYLNDIIKSDVSAAFGYGEGAEAIKISKKGSEIKSMAQSKKAVYDNKYQSLMSQKNEIKQQLTQQGFEFEQKEYGERVAGYNYESIPQDIRDQIYKFEDLVYQCQEINKDIKTLQVLIENIQDNKNYNLTVNQLSVLKID